VVEDQVKILKFNKGRVTSFKRGGKLQGLGKNHSSAIVGARGRRVRIPRTADSFKSKTDNT
jgi:hypothetical protein